MTWVDIPVRLFLYICLSICPFIKDSGRISCQIISICPSVQPSIVKRHGQTFLSDYFYLSICPSVHSVKGGGGQTFLSDYFYLSVCPSVHSFKRVCRVSSQIIFICPSVHLPILSREGIDFPVRLFLSVRLSILKRQGQDFLSDISICPSVRLSILITQAHYE